MTDEHIKISDISFLLGMSFGLNQTMLNLLPESDVRQNLIIELENIRDMIEKIYYKGVK